MPTRAAVLRSSLSLLLLLSPLAAGAARRPAPHPFLDLDFEAPECSGGWQSSVRDFETALDPSDPHSGRQSLRLASTTSDPGALGVVLRNFPVAGAAGRHVRFTGWIRTDGVSSGAPESGVGLWWRADGEGDSVLALGNSERALGTTPWTQYSLDVDVPAGTRSIVFGAFFVGRGTAWLDGFAVEVGGVRWADGKPTSTAPPAKAAVTWLRKQAVPIATPEAGNGFGDLERLRKVIGDARVVSLGEDTHGTREFFQMKHRLVEFLASEMGFTRFAIEANMPEAYLMNDYVLNGRGDPKELLKGMYFWTWNTQEVLDMVEWMRDFNRSGRGRIEFLGFDMQFPGVAANVVRRFVAKAEPGYSGAADQALLQAERTVSDSQNGRSVDSAPQAEEAARSVYEHLASQRDAYAGRLPEADVDWAVQNARVVLQSVQVVTGTVSRDRSMADNVEWILDHAEPGAKIVLWAHNLHVGKQGDQMGAHLAERYGKGMVVLGFAFGEGVYNAVGTRNVGPHEAAPPVAGSVESYLATAGLPSYLVDLRKVPASAAPWLAQPRLFREIGAVAVRCGFSESVAAQQFDGLIWFGQTNPSVLLPFQ